MSFIGSYNPHLLDGVQHVHFIGCGGSGTYPLIQILHSRELTISGSDVEEMARIGIPARKIPRVREELQRLIAADPALRDRKMVLQLARQIAAEIL